MAAWIWVLIPLVAIIGGFIIEYQKNKMSMMNRSRQNEEEVEDLRKLVNALKGRIENLEAIAAGEPEEFSTGSGRGMEEIEIEEEPSIKEQNQQEVSNMADKRRTK
ncbi:hypothetical protein [Fodinibius halophilus]|uniref:Phage shock protein B n=1 Tax=Fodinibius halophilus TaxID=1736908 RepID=A0A6M1SUS1_9BACT|nr:hypothetical protein [Fodinibius halophilus]NGP87316.1 hypothetical protein [Fodinibius halophilus]